MKKLALIIAIVLITIGTTNAKNSFDKAISSCKSVSTKDIKKSLCESKTFIELRDEQYVLVKDHVKIGLENTLSEYQKFSKKNGKKIGNNKKEFKIDLDDKIKKEVKTYLSSYRGVLLEESTKALDSLYIESITQLILKQYYIETLLTAMTQHMSGYIEFQEKDYINFITNSTLDPKIDQNDAMSKMTAEYLKSKSEGQRKVFSCLIDAYKISKEYGVAIKKIDYKQKYDFKYIKTLITIANKILSGNSDKGMLPKDAIVIDIKSHIKNSTGIQ